jgi:hypothetical protein
MKTIVSVISNSRKETVSNFIFRIYLCSILFKYLKFI